MDIVISILDILSPILGFICNFAVYKAIAVFIPARKHWLVQALAFLLLRYLAFVIVYLDDPWNISLALVGFAVYSCLLFSKMGEKSDGFPYFLSHFAVNFLRQNVFSDFFLPSVVRRTRFLM